MKFCFHLQGAGAVPPLPPEPLPSGCCGWEGAGGLGAATRAGAMARSVPVRSEGFQKGEHGFQLPRKSLFSPQENRRMKELCWEKESLATALCREYPGLSPGALWCSRRLCLSKSSLIPLSVPPSSAPVSPLCSPGEGATWGLP